MDLAAYLKLEVDDFVEEISWQGAVFGISAATGEGTDTLCRHVMAYMEDCREKEQFAPEVADQELEQQKAMQAEGRQRIEELRRTRRSSAVEEDDDGLDDDHDVEVVYAE